MSRPQPLIHIIGPAGVVATGREYRDGCSSPETVFTWATPLPALPWQEMKRLELAACGGAGCLTVYDEADAAHEYRFSTDCDGYDGD